jgi:hypothetical protein
MFADCGGQNISQGAWLFLDVFEEVGHSQFPESNVPRQSRGFLM